MVTNIQFSCLYKNLVIFDIHVKIEGWQGWTITLRYSLVDDASEAFVFFLLNDKKVTEKANADQYLGWKI